MSIIRASTRVNVQAEVSVEVDQEKWNAASCEDKILLMGKAINSLDFQLENLYPIADFENIEPFGEVSIGGSAYAIHNVPSTLEIEDDQGNSLPQEVILHDPQE